MVATLSEAFGNSENKVCIFDIDNTITHGISATEDDCCCNNSKCLLNRPAPAWPTKYSGTNKYVKEAIRNCKEAGYKLAIATAETGLESVNPKQKKFINDLFGPNIYNTNMYQNACKAQGYKRKCNCASDIERCPDCCNTEYKDKTRMYINIMNELNIKPENYDKSIVFDDEVSNLTTASQLGFNVCQASTNCGGGKYCDVGCGIGRTCAKLPLLNIQK